MQNFNYQGGQYPFVLSETVKIELSNGQTVKIPKLLKTDGRSIPWFLQWWITRWPYDIRPVLFHDAAYILDWRVDELGLKRAKEWADGEFLYLSLKYANNKRERNEAWLCYYGVKYFGWKVFKKRQNG